MAKVTFSLCLASFFLCFILWSNYVEGIEARTWCVAKVNSTDQQLQQIIDNLCGKLICKEIQPGGSCFDPNTLQNHASFAIDLNFKVVGMCDPSYATLIITNPSRGTCVYP